MLSLSNSLSSTAKRLENVWSRSVQTNVETQLDRADAGIPHQVLGSVGRNRQDSLPYYARLVGTLNPYMPDIGKDLIAVVSSECSLFISRR